MQVRLHGISWGKCNSNSNYISLTQIKIIGTHVTKFRKPQNAPPQHATFKPPRQASPNLTNFGNTWKYICSSVASFWSLEGTTYVNLWIHRHGAACGQGFVSEQKKMCAGEEKCSCPVRFGFVFHNNSLLFPINFTNFLQLCRHAPAVIKPLFDLNVRLLPPSSPPCGFNFSQPYSPELVCAGKSAFTPAWK
jgi:hypothetical protein